MKVLDRGPPQETEFYCYLGFCFVLLLLTVSLPVALSLQVCAQGGYFQIRRSGGLEPHIKFGGKTWGKVRPSSPNKRENLGSSVTTRRKS